MFSQVTVKGYAWSGGGRGIIRVEVSADGGKTWHQATLRGIAQKLHRQWAWKLFEATIPLPNDTTKAELICKVSCGVSIDLGFRFEAYGDKFMSITSRIICQV